MTPNMSSQIWHIERILTEKEWTVPKPEKEVAQNKDTIEETEELKTYGLGVNSASNKC